MMTDEKEKMTKGSNSLDPVTAGFLEEFAKIFTSIEHLPIADQRTVIKEMFRISEEQFEPIAKVEDKVVSGRHGPINIRLFIPKSEGALPVIVYFHRGGWVYGSIEESETICRRLANETGAIVAAVEYRLAPEHKFPIPLEDCYDAAKWLAANASSFSGNPGKLILCGESAGGNLAAAIALMNRDAKEFAVAGQLLIYPVLTNDLEKKYYEDSPDKLLLSFENMEFFWQAYLSSPRGGENPYASPLKSDNLTNLPPCFIVSAEYDALKHEGARYAKALHRAGITVQAKCYPGVIHGFLDLPLAETIRNEAIEDISAWVKKL